MSFSTTGIILSVKSDLLIENIKFNDTLSTRETQQMRNFALSPMLKMRNQSAGNVSAKSTLKTGK